MQSLTELADGPVFWEAGGQLIRDPSGEIVGALGVTGDVNEVDTSGAIRRHPCQRFSRRCRLRPRGGQAPQYQVDPPLVDPRDQ